MKMKLSKLFDLFVFQNVICFSNKSSKSCDTYSSIMWYMCHNTFGECGDPQKNLICWCWNVKHLYLDKTMKTKKLIHYIMIVSVFGGTESPHSPLPTSLTKKPVRSMVVYGVVYVSNGYEKEGDMGGGASHPHSKLFGGTKSPHNPHYKNVTMVGKQRLPTFCSNSFLKSSPPEKFDLWCWNVKHFYLDKAMKTKELIHYIMIVSVWVMLGTGLAVLSDFLYIRYAWDQNIAHPDSNVYNCTVNVINSEHGTRQCGKAQCPCCVITYNLTVDT